MSMSETSHHLQPLAPPGLRRLRWLLLLLPAVSLLLGATLTVRGDAAAAQPGGGLGRPIALLRAWLLPDAVTWSGFGPAGWVTALPIESQITAEGGLGLDPATAAYASSTDTSASWS